MTTLSTRTVVGSASKTFWSQVHVFHPIGEKVGSHGSLMVALCISSAEALKRDIAFDGRQILNELHDGYYLSDPSRDVKNEILPRVFEATIKAHKSEIVNGIVGVYSTHGVGDQRNLTCCSYGPANGVLFRNGKIYRLFRDSPTEGEAPEIQKTFGVLAKHDALILATGSFFQTFSPASLTKLSQTSDLDEISSWMAPIVQESDLGDRIAALVTHLIEDEGVGSVEVQQAATQPIVKQQQQPSPSPFRERITHVLHKLRSTGFRQIIGLHLPAHEHEINITLRDGQDRKTRFMYSLAIALLFLLGISVFFGWRHRMEKVRNEQFSQIWDVVDHQYAEALALTTLNPLRAKSLLDEAKGFIEESLGKTEGQLKREQEEQLRNRLNEVTQALSDLSGERIVSNPQVFLDLSLVRPDTKGDRLSLYQDTLVVLDRSSGVVLRVNLSTKSAETVGGGSLLTDSRLVSLSAGRGFVLSEIGIVEVLIGNKTSVVVVESDSQWGEIVDMESFGANLYLLDKTRGMILRYQGVEGGFDDTKNWLVESIPSLMQAISMSIDGDIWVLTNDAVLQLRRGREEGFQLALVDTAFVDPIQLYTDGTSPFIYVLDHGSKRVVLFHKDTGEYAEQYVWDGMQSVSDFVVFEEQRMMYLLSGNLLYAIPLSGVE